MDKSVLDIYTDYLISSFGQTTATGLSALGWSQPLAMISYVSGLPYSLMTIFS